jgi:hypothetical protein
MHHANQMRAAKLQGNFGCHRICRKSGILKSGNIHTIKLKKCWFFKNRYFSTSLILIFLVQKNRINNI